MTLIYGNILILLGFMLIAYFLDMWYTHIDNKRITKGLELLEREREYEKLLRSLNNKSYNPLSYEAKDIPDVLPELVEILPRTPVFDKATYLQSQQWKDIRKVILKRDNFTCCRCHRINIPLEIHHITYARLGHEEYSDLASVCRTCHQTIHDKYGYDYNSTFPTGG